MPKVFPRFATDFVVSMQPAGCGCDDDDDGGLKPDGCAFGLVRERRGRVLCEPDDGVVEGRLWGSESVACGFPQQRGPARSAACHDDRERGEGGLEIDGGEDVLGDARDPGWVPRAGTKDRCGVLVGLRGSLEDVAGERSTRSVWEREREELARADGGSLGEAEERSLEELEAGEKSTPSKGIRRVGSQPGERPVGNIVAPTGRSDTQIGEGNTIEHRSDRPGSKSKINHHPRGRRKHNTRTRDKPHTRDASVERSSRHSLNHACSSIGRGSRAHNKHDLGRRRSR